MPENEQDPPVGYWAAFGYQNHVVPVRDGRARDGESAGLCGVMTAPANIVEPDERPTCSVCAEAVREGRYRVVGMSG